MSANHKGSKILKILITLICLPNNIYTNPDRKYIYIWLMMWRRTISRAFFRVNFHACHRDHFVNDGGGGLHPPHFSLLQPHNSQRYDKKFTRLLLRQRSMLRYITHWSDHFLMVSVTYIAFIGVLFRYYLSAMQFIYLTKCNIYSNVCRYQILNEPRTYVQYPQFCGWQKHLS